MKGYPKSQAFLRIVFTLVVIGLIVAWQPGTSTRAQSVSSDVLYTTDADFNQGTLVSVNHNAPNNNQLQLDSITAPFPFINVAASARGTVVRANTETGNIVGEYRTAPEGRGLDPSRTTVDLFGNVWTANRAEGGIINGLAYGSAVKIGLIVGGTRVGANGSPDPAGEFLAPPYGYNTCVDRNKDGLIHTSKGLGNILAWPDITDGMGGADGIVQDAVDECILVYQRLPDAEGARHVSVDADNNVWVGGYPYALRMFYKLNGATGTILDSFDARKIGCGGYGGLIDGNGILWSVGGPLLRYDPVAKKGFCIQQNGYGLGIDTNGYIWMSLWDGGVVKIAPDGSVLPGYPKPTFPPSMMASTLETPAESSLLSAVSRNTTAAPQTSSQAPQKDGGAPKIYQPARASSAREQAPAAFSQSAAVGTVTPLDEPAQPTFMVAPVDESVEAMNPWTPGATITLTVHEGGTVVYATSQKANDGGGFWFGMRGVFDLRAGQVVTVSDGTTTKSHTIQPLAIDSINVAADTISGRAGTGAGVDVWVNGVPQQTVTPDSSGRWGADFSGQADITYLSDGGTHQIDEDGDATVVWWSAPRLQADPDEEWVQSSGNWTTGATITLSVLDGGSVVLSDSRIVDADGHFNFNLTGRFDLRPGQVVEVTDGPNVKRHTVTPLSVDRIDLAADTLSGRADAGTGVDIWVNGDGGKQVTPDGSGNWTADFSGETDLTFQTSGGVQQRDDDGDSTFVSWATPRIVVSPDDHWVVNASRWTPGKTATLTIHDGGAVVYTGSQAIDAYGNFNFNLWNVFDPQRGQVVTVTDGTITKSLTIANLFADKVDVAADILTGRAAAGAAVEVRVNGYDGQNFTTDATGKWTADFSGQIDLTYLSDGAVQQFDADGDSTHVSWSAPRFQVAPDDEWVQSWSRWTPGTTITLTVQDGGAVVYSDSQVTDAQGNFNFNLWNRFDLQRGQVVTVTDGISTKSHTILPLYVDRVNLATDTISGRAEPGASVEAWVNGYPSQNIMAGGTGDWSANFSSVADLTYRSDGGAQQRDADYDSTFVSWASPRIEASAQDNWVGSFSRWTPGTTITMTVQDGGSVVYSDSQAADSRGNFWFDLWNGFDLQPGQVVTVTDGLTTKMLTLANLFVDKVDVAASTISGRADAGASGEAWVSGYPGQIFTTGADGKWAVDFSAQTHLTYRSDGGSRQYDDDGDATNAGWSAPRFAVGPDDHWVSSWSRWTPGATITMTVQDGGSVVYSDSQTADSSGNFNFNLWNLFDPQRGQVVTVTDGTNTKTHTILPLYIDSIDVAADTISGRADPGKQVEANLWNFNNLYATAGPDGKWSIDFSGQTDLTYLSEGDARQYDDDGDGTQVHLRSPSFQADVFNNSVYQGNSWKAGATVTVTVARGGVEVYKASQVTDTYGNFNFGVSGIALQTGDMVTVTDGALTKTHTVNAVSVDSIDATADQVHGSATPGAHVWVWAYLFDKGSGRNVYAGADGKWTADFSVASPADGQPRYDLTGITSANANEFDDEGDSTSRHAGPQQMQNRGVVVTPVDNNIWIANSAMGTVTRLDNNGNVLKAIPTGDQPTGVAVDADGKVWAANLGSSTAVRIDPLAGSDGLGAVDLAVDLGPGAGPYNYSDMTGAVAVGSTSPQGFWTMVQDGQTPGFQWGRITWNAEPQGKEPAGTAIVVEARAADTQAGLGGQAFQSIVNGSLFSMQGRFIEVRVTLKASQDGVSPVLSDIRIQPSVLPVGIDIKPGSYPNSINCVSKTETIAVAILTTQTFDALSVNYTTVTFEGAKEIHLVKKLPVRHVEDVDHDGDMDLVFHFLRADTALTCSSTSGQLKGFTYGGIPVVGTDSVRMTKK